MEFIDLNKHIIPDVFLNRLWRQFLDSHLPLIVGLWLEWFISLLECERPINRESHSPIGLYYCCGQELLMLYGATVLGARTIETLDVKSPVIAS